MTTLDAWSEYPIWSRDVVIMAGQLRQGPLYVLKTDANNEAIEDEDAPGFHPRPIVPFIANLCEVHCIEIDQKTVDLARVKFPDLDIRQGDIRNLPYRDACFDVVIDLSTIDHVLEYEQVLDEYWRVLVPNGLTLIVCWLDSHAQEAGEQMWFNHDEFLLAVSARFDIVETKYFTDVHGIYYHGHLAKVVCKKRTDT